MAKAAWTGAIEFGGFPIHVSAYSLTKSTRVESFKTLCPCHQQPIVQQRVCAVDGTVVNYDECGKGYEVGKNDVRPIAPEAVEAIKAGERSEMLDIEALPPKEGVPFYLALGRYRLIPNDKVPGSEQPVQILWNGLMATGRALVTEVVMRAGSPDSILAVTADTHGLTGVTLPYEDELKVDVPEFLPVANEQAAAMFEAFAQQQGIDLGEFAHTTFKSDFQSRRTEALKAALAGQPVPVSAQAPAAPPVADLMSMMSAALDATGKAPAKGKAKPKAKAKAKAA